MSIFEFLLYNSFLPHIIYIFNKNQKKKKEDQIEIVVYIQV